METYEELKPKLEAFGEEQVKNNMANGVYTSYRKDMIIAWLNDLASAKRDKREERTLAIADEANSIASDALLIAKESVAARERQASAADRQSRYALYAVIIAIIASIIAAAAYIKTP